MVISLRSLALSKQHLWARYPMRFACTVVSSWMIHITLGCVFTWGNIVQYVASYMAATGSDVTLNQLSWVLSLTTVMQAVCCFCSGWVITVLGARRTALLGAWTMSLGIFLSAFTVGFGRWPFILTYSVLGGSGIGLAYMAPIFVLMQWMPSMKGLASGIVVCGLGAGGFLTTTLQKGWINPEGRRPGLMRHGVEQPYYDHHDPGVWRDVLRHVPSLFWVEALIFCSMQFAGFLFLLEPPSDRKREDEDAFESIQPLGGPPAAQAPRQRQYSVAEMVATRQFWCIFLSFFFSAHAVFFALTYEKVIGAQIVAGMTDGQLSTAMGLCCLCNSFGRVVWGLVGDFSSFRVAMAICTVCQVVLLLSLHACSRASEYILSISLLFFCMGGTYSLFPAATAIYFGVDRVASNYGVVFLGNGLAEVSGALLVGRTMPASGDVTLQTYVFAGILSLGLATLLLIGPPSTTQACSEVPVSFSDYGAAGEMSSSVGARAGRRS